jgi:hypothetical protein
LQAQKELDLVKKRHKKSSILFGKIADNQQLCGAKKQNPY